MDFKKDENRIYLEGENGKVIAEITYPENEDGVCTITHTIVDSSLQGQGVAGKLTQEAYNDMKARNKKVKPVCSYAQKWFENNPDKRDILKD